MGDGSPSRKKRGADRQITKDDNSDEEAPVEFGTFKRASDEVLATRKIVKVKRTGAGNSNAPNPFASIQMASVPSPAKVEAPELNAKAVTPEPPGEDESNVKVADGSEVKVTEDKEEGANGHGKEVEKGCENGEKAEEEKAGAAVATGFQQVSSTPNAFGTFTTGFSFSTSSSFTFGSSAGTTAFSFGGSSGAASTFSFASASTTGGFMSFSAPSLTTQMAAPSSSDAPAAQANYATVTLQEVAVETGEEKESAVFGSDAVLYEFVDKSWKERGKGELKLNLSEDMKARLLMRSKGNFKLLLNAGLFPDMKTSKMDGRSVTFACVNSAAGKDGLTTYAVKMRDSGAISQLLDLIEQHKGGGSSATPTPATTEETSQAAAGAEEEKSQPASEKEDKDPDEAV